MAKFALGKHAYGISDRSGFRYPLLRMKKEWTGALVGFDEWEAKQPQLEPRRHITDPQALRDSYGGDDMSFTYGQLKQAIQDYTENDETSFVNNLPLFIQQAEERILKQVQLSLFRKNATAFTDIGNPYLAVPADFLAPYSLSFRTVRRLKEFLEFKDISFLQEFTPTPSTQGEPRYYGQFDVDNFLLVPTPDAGVYTMELHYLYRPQSITELADSGTTWLSTNAPMAMLYGSLIEAYIYMKGEPTCWRSTKSACRNRSSASSCWAKRRKPPTSIALAKL
jgi:hypothetical protein